MKTIDEYAKDLRTDDFLEAAHQAKEKSRELFDDQGITSLALVLSDTLADMIRNPEKVRQRAHEQLASLS
jgi:hypothetical protein